jgi:TfoX/Sxy family transcriptional regulator of competence genes
LASRIRSLLAERDDVREQRMFGGLAFLVGGKMAVGIIGDDLMVRVGRDAYDEALARPHTRPMDFTGRPMKGMVYVAPDGIGTDRELAGWVDAGATFAASLHE